MARILVVEDEVDICNLLRKELEAEGHSVVQAFDGPAALVAVEKQNPHLIILDWMLPGLDGLSVCRRIRQNYLAPIIMLTARNEEVDRILGLEVGADDYISKPFSIRELTARVRAMLRRVELDSRSGLVAGPPAEPAASATPPVQAPETIVRGPLSINMTARTAQLEGQEIDLTPREYDLVVLLTSHPGRAFSREFLLQQLWGYDYDGFDRTVDTHITRLRKKLGPLGEKIVTVWGVGYRFVS
jgi:DNA-binding response OmpR family regulator